MAEKPAANTTNGSDSSPAIRQFITVTIDKQVFGIPVLAVNEVLQAQKMTAIPLAPPQVAGVLNLRGRIVTAIDVRRALDLPPLPTGKKAMYVVLQSHGEYYSLVVDSVGDVMDLPQSAYERAPATLEARWREVSTGIYRLDNRLLLVLDVERLLNFGRARAA